MSDLRLVWTNKSLQLTSTGQSESTCLSASGDKQSLPHQLTRIYSEQAIFTSIVSIVLYPKPELQPDQLRQGLGSQIASAASGITGLIGVTDASVTTASFHLPICPFRPSRVVHTPGVHRNRAHMEGCGCVSFNSASCGRSPLWHQAKHLMWYRMDGCEGSVWACSRRPVTQMTNLHQPAVPLNR